MIEIDIPRNIRPGSIPLPLIETAVERILKAVLPNEDFSVTANYKGYDKITLSWTAVS